MSSRRAARPCRLNAAVGSQHVHQPFLPEVSLVHALFRILFLVVCGVFGAALASCIGAHSSAPPDGGIAEDGANAEGGLGNDIPGKDGGNMPTSADAGAVGCTSDTQCQGKDRVCSVPSHECVECLTTSDCLPPVGEAGAGGGGLVDAGAGGPVCVNNACVTYTPCVNSLGCASGLVCDTSLGHCVQCAKDADCAMNEHCANSTCHVKCASDNVCTPAGLLCDTSLGYCTQCVAHSDCPVTSFCSNGQCMRDVCIGNSTRCQQNGISTCSAIGSGWGVPTPCASGQTCTAASGTPVCTTWICQPGTIGCAATGDEVISCSADGLTATNVTDCAAQNDVCVSGACAAVVCKAGTRYCDSNTIRTCSAKGDSSTLYQSCGTTTYCDSSTSTPTCAALVCTPNQPACSGQIATTCNSVGSGYVAGGVDCTSSSQVCVQGACVAATYTVDTADPMPTSGTATAINGALKFDYYSVTTSRTLREIEMYLGTTTTPTTNTMLTWRVYEATTENGTYGLISSTDTTASATTPQYFASGALSVPLVAGRFYAIGVAWNSNTGYYSKGALAAPQPTSFGTLLGGYSLASIPTSLSFVNGPLSAIRITTSQ
jgi:hypothetical protein